MLATSFDLAAVSHAANLGETRMANMAGLGALAASSGLCRLDTLAEAARALVPEKHVDGNLAALRAGFRLAAHGEKGQIQANR